MAFSDLTDRALGAIKDAFGSSVTYTPTSGSPVTIDGVFNRRYYELVEGDVPVSTDQPNLLVRIADLAADPVEGDEVTVSGQTYRVYRVEKDGEGAALLLLHETS